MLASSPPPACFATDARPASWDLRTKLDDWSPDRPPRGDVLLSTFPASCPYRQRCHQLQLPHATCAPRTCNLLTSCTCAWVCILWTQGKEKMWNLWPQRNSKIAGALPSRCISPSSTLIAISEVFPKVLSRWKSKNVDGPLTAGGIQGVNSDKTWEASANMRLLWLFFWQLLLRWGCFDFFFCSHIHDSIYFFRDFSVWVVKRIRGRISG